MGSASTMTIVDVSFLGRLQEFVEKMSYSLDSVSASAIADVGYMSLVQDVFENTKFMDLLKYPHHNNSTRLDHCIHVSYSCYRHYVKARGRYKYIKEMVRGALLHDFFLYDYNKERTMKKHYLHGFFHPRVSLKQAEAEFELTKIERSVILRHMFPLTLIPPCSRAAWWVIWFDKYWAVKELICKF